MTLKTRKTSNLKLKTPLPKRIEDHKDRGVVFRYLISELGMGVKDFSEATGIPTSTLGRYFNGTQDVAEAPAEIANALLRGLGLPDTEVWERLAIPEARRWIFRSDRTPPVGHGPEVIRTVHETLKQPMFGARVLDIGDGIELEPENFTSGIQVVQLPDGRLHAILPGEVPSQVKRRLGRLVSVQIAS